MADIYCYCYVEDQPSADVAKKLVEYRNANHEHMFLFRDGFPLVKHGFGDIKNMIPSFLNMSRSGIYTFIITDLDSRVCVGRLIRDWFGIANDKTNLIPKELVFRVAVREIESWILADRKEWADFIDIPERNFQEFPDDLEDPKRFLLNVLRKKGKKKFHKEMLPRGDAHIGPRYNEILCDFIKNRWSPSRAADNSPSLKRALDALGKIPNP